MGYRFKIPAYSGTPNIWNNFLDSLTLAQRATWSRIWSCLQEHGVIDYGDLYITFKTDEDFVIFKLKFS